MRNLTQGEIVDQILEVQIQCHPLPHPPPSRGRDGERGTRVTNVVLMGMGEPLANYDNVVSAIRIMTDTKCLGLSKRHVTLSTSGLVPEIERLAKEGLDIKLAISLNATTDEARSAIMPVNKKYPLALLSKALKKYAEATGRHRLTFEYVVIDGQNDSAEDAKRLVKLLSHIKAKVNLIPLNAMPPHPVPPPRGGRVRERVNLQAPSEASIQRFAQLLRNKNIQVNIRNSRGADILAACGQLSGGTTRS
ncbi:MAG: 23S rRNA (adenine(2503)-C(2))-methyltransferase RlmN [Deltaproteobacteria bacterium]|nr:23S rRNA (adenine(2503)-C(2))-methyltransferase RlmN [Deltaproteobacteria bacterium]